MTLYKDTVQLIAEVYVSRYHEPFNAKNAKGEAVVLPKSKRRSSGRFENKDMWRLSSSRR